jgi:ABC-type polysaccharide/polyol phosphate transport system ATPase subunit
MSTVVEIKDLSLLFPLRLRKTASLRDVFVQAFQSPLETFFKAPQTLEILHGFNLEIKRGERVALIGVNGIGKSTLCRAIAGIYRPTRGSIRVYGKTRAVFDTAVGIYPDLTGRENAEILTELLYPTLKDRKQRLREALDFTELGTFLDTPYRHYSNGMQARLCLSILTMEPTDLLILDEVFEGADQFFREKIAKRVVDVIERSGAVIFISHAEDQIRRVCNRAVLIKNGRVAFDGSVDAGLLHYAESCNPRAGHA